MMSAPLLQAILFSATTLWSPSHPVRDVYEGSSHVRMQNKLKELCRELVLDAEMKMKAVQQYRSQYYKSQPYQVGNIISKLRDQFKQMVTKYQLVERNISYLHFDHNENVKIFIEVRRMATDIETQVDMIREWQVKRVKAEEHHNNMKDPLRSGAGRDYDESEELLREAVARGRMARGRGGRTPPARAPGGGAKRKNNKWQYFRGYELV